MYVIIPPLSSALSAAGSAPDRCYRGRLAIAIARALAAAVADALRGPEGARAEDGAFPTWIHP